MFRGLSYYVFIFFIPFFISIIFTFPLFTYYYILYLTSYLYFEFQCWYRILPDIFPNFCSILCFADRASWYNSSKWSTWWTLTLYKTFIIIILYMFRATLCSSSGGRIVLIQQVQPAHRTVTYREYYNRCCINTIRPSDDEHSVARNT